MSYTYAQLQARVLNELNRPGLANVTTDIQAAIKSAIEHYERERFWFNEEISTSTSTTASQNYVAAPSDLVFLDKVQITVGSTKYTLKPVPYEEWSEHTANTTTGQPTEFCYYKDRLNLHPTPGSTYTLTISYVKRLTALSVSSDTNGWTDYGEELIRQRSLADMRINRLFEPWAINDAQAFAARGEQFLSPMEKIAYLRLKSDSDSRLGVGRVKPRFL